MNIDYFIKKFEAIPDHEWITHTVFDPSTGKRCALGHCGAHAKNVSGKFTFHHTPESKALIKIFHQHGVSVASVNNGRYVNFQQATPKARILAALEILKGLHD